MPKPTRQSTFTRAWADTKAAYSGWWFWAVQLVCIAAISVWVVTLYPKNASVLQTAIIQGAAVVGTAFVFALLVLAAFFVALSPRRQRDDAWESEEQLGAKLEEIRANQVMRLHLMSARVAIGTLLGEMAPLLSVIDKETEDDHEESTGKSLEMFRKGLKLCSGDYMPTLDQSHMGRLYAAASLARRPLHPEALLHPLDAIHKVNGREIEALIVCLTEFIAEINAEIIRLPPLSIPGRAVSRL